MRKRVEEGKWYRDVVNKNLWICFSKVFNGECLINAERKLVQVDKKSAVIADTVLLFISYPFQHGAHYLW